MKLRCEEAGDMEPYYQKYEWDRPDTPEEEAARIKRNQEWERKEAQRAKRRRGGGGGGRSGPAIDWVKEEQADTARAKGRDSAGKVNLQPFISGNTDRKKVG